MQFDYLFVSGTTYCFPIDVRLLSVIHLFHWYHI